MKNNPDRSQSLELDRRSVCPLHYTIDPLTPVTKPHLSAPDNSGSQLPFSCLTDYENLSTKMLEKEENFFQALQAVRAVYYDSLQKSNILQGEFVHQIFGNYIAIYNFVEQLSRSTSSTALLDAVLSRDGTPLEEFAIHFAVHTQPLLLHCPEILQDSFRQCQEISREQSRPQIRSTTPAIGDLFSPVEPQECGGLRSGVSVCDAETEPSIASTERTLSRLTARNASSTDSSTPSPRVDYHALLSATLKKITPHPFFDPSLLPIHCSQLYTVLALAATRTSWYRYCAHALRYPRANEFDAITRKISVQISSHVSRRHAEKLESQFSGDALPRNQARELLFDCTVMMLAFAFRRKRHLFLCNDVLVIGSLESKGKSKVQKVFGISPDLIMEAKPDSYHKQQYNVLTVQEHGKSWTLLFESAEERDMILSLVDGQRKRDNARPIYPHKNA